MATNSSKSIEITGFGNNNYCGEMGGHDQDRELNPNIEKSMDLEPKCNESLKVDVKSETNISHLHSHEWRSIIPWMPDSDVIALSSVCKNLQQIVREMKSGFNLRRNYHMNEDCFLNHALSETCKFIDISYCWWLSANTIQAILTKTNLRHLHVIECEISPDCVRSICNLQLRSLSFSYTNEWRSYFVENVKKESPFIIQTLNQLEIKCCPHFSPIGSFIFDVYVNVLQHCKELQHLRLFEDFEICWNDFGSDTAHCRPRPTFFMPPSHFPSHSTPLMKLTSLEVAIEGKNKCRIDLVSFLKTIHRGKLLIPLTNVDFGSDTCYLLQKGVLCDLLILPQTRFVLRKHDRLAIPHDSIASYERYESKISTWMDQTTYEKVFVEQIKFNDFEPFADQIASASGKSIKEVYIRDCIVIEKLVKGIQLFAINCPQIEALQVTIIKEITTPYNGYHDFIENEAFLEVLTNFKNLKKLAISAGFLQCFYKYEDEFHIKIMPFSKVTKACQHLLEIRLEHSETLPPPIIHENSLYDIAHCENLRVLHLSNFSIGGDADFQLSNITENCSKLERLSIASIITEYPHSFNFGDDLRLAKNLRVLCLERKELDLTKPFLKCLCLCKKLENLKFCSRAKYKLGDFDNLIQILPKFKNLFVFELKILSCDAVLNKQLLSLIDKIKNRRPRFSGSLHV